MHSNEADNPEKLCHGDGRCLARARINGQATEMPTKRKTNSVVCELNGKAGKGKDNVGAQWVRSKIN